MRLRDRRCQLGILGVDGCKEIDEPESKTVRSISSTIQEEECNRFICPLQASSSDWTEWTECTKTCRGGMRMRAKRKCVSPKKQKKDVPEKTKKNGNTRGKRQADLLEALMAFEAQIPAPRTTRKPKTPKTTTTAASTIEDLFGLLEFDTLNLDTTESPLDALLATSAPAIDPNDLFNLIQTTEPTFLQDFLMSTIPDLTTFPTIPTIPESTPLYLTTIPDSTTEKLKTSDVEEALEFIQSTISTFITTTAIPTAPPQKLVTSKSSRRKSKKSPKSPKSRVSSTQSSPTVPGTTVPVTTSAAGTLPATTIPATTIASSLDESQNLNTTTVMSESTVASTVSTSIAQTTLAALSTLANLVTSVLVMDTKNNSTDIVTTTVLENSLNVTMSTPPNVLTPNPTVVPDGLNSTELVDLDQTDETNEDSEVDEDDAVDSSEDEIGETVVGGIKIELEEEICDFPSYWKTINETEPCNTYECPSWSQWGRWSVCSVTCGGGSEFRYRDCLRGKVGENMECPQGGEAEERTGCFDNPCPYLEEWAEWSDCPVTCGGGKMTRERTCMHGLPTNIGCLEGTSEESDCNTKPCPIFWSEWGEWGDCSEYCGDGFRNRTRECENARPGLDCGEGSYNETEPCNDGYCSGEFYEPHWAKWGEWGPCSETCGEGIATRSRDCDGDTVGSRFCKWEASMENGPCEVNPCPEWSPWGSWNACNINCTDPYVVARYTMGNRERTRSCHLCPYDSMICKKPDDFAICEELFATDPERGRETELCDCYTELTLAEIDAALASINQTTDSVVTTWSLQEDSPVNMTESDNSTDSKSNETEVTINEANWWLEDSEVEDTDSIPIKLEEEQQDPEKFVMGKIPVIPAEWGEWDDWSTCSVTCGPGKRLRRRHCATGEIGQPGCGIKGVKQEQNCLIRRCKLGWSQWEHWTDCSATCGQGVRSRKRECSNPEKLGQHAACPKHNAYVIEPCKLGICIKWLEWTDWSACSVSCGSGRQVRSRKCDGEKKNCPGANIETNICFIPLDDERCMVPSETWLEKSLSNDELAPDYEIIPEFLFQTTANPYETNADLNVLDDMDGSLGVPTMRPKPVTLPSSLLDLGMSIDDYNPGDFDDIYGNYDFIFQTTPNPMISNAAMFTTAAKPVIEIISPMEGNSVLSGYNFETIPKPKLWSEWSDWSSCSLNCSNPASRRNRRRQCVALDKTLCDKSDQIEVEKCECEEEESIQMVTKSPTTVMTTSTSQTSQDVAMVPAENSDPESLPSSPFDPPQKMQTTLTASLPPLTITTTVATSTSSSVFYFDFLTTAADPEGFGWSNWGPWQPCTRTCGEGVTSRNRYCKGGDDGYDCFGGVANSIQSKECEMGRCAKMSGWGEWTECSITCGGAGQRTRSQTCLNRSWDEKICEEVESMDIPIVEEQPCEYRECPRFGDWTLWTECDRECPKKGLRSRARNCHFGELGVSVECIGESEEYEECFHSTCPYWTSWSDWTNCSKSCNNGERVRERDCENGNIGDINCNTGENIEVLDCATEPCPHWSDWGPWSPCHHECGNSTSTQTRLCKGAPFGDPGCPGLAERTKPCESKCGIEEKCVDKKCVCWEEAGWLYDADVGMCVRSDVCLECADVAICNMDTFECDCPRGYDGDGYHCFDRNECLLQLHKCESIAICANTEGSYRCECPDGYEADANSDKCVDYDECVTREHNCHEPEDWAAAPEQTRMKYSLYSSFCRNTEGSFECECNSPGFIGNGTHCEQVSPGIVAAQTSLKGPSANILTKLNVDSCVGTDGILEYSFLISGRAPFEIQVLTERNPFKIDITSPPGGQMITSPPYLIELKIEGISSEPLFANDEIYQIGVTDLQYSTKVSTILMKSDDIINTPGVSYPLL